MDFKECFALKSFAGILKFLVSDVRYINRLEPSKPVSAIVKKTSKNKNFKLVSQSKETPFLQAYFECENGYYYITPADTGFGYYVDGELDPVFRKEIIVDERSLAEAIVASPASVSKYVPASKITKIKTEATIALFNQDSSNPHLTECLDIIDEFVAQISDKLEKDA